MTTVPVILCLNSGSSSLKFALYQFGAASDTLVFTGGIGEQAAPVRWDVCRGLAHPGIQLDSQQNDHHATVISSRESHCMVRVVPTNEDL